ncbi:hypothetical protein IWQ62_005186 [Dispira parvispora]|uniref:Uncharacterized protein n=1 Tax=Dispira parvispora TaxID=1520584 RepID=A0A9W8AQE6_9FUNG|nr:hypothetical protein IWQ62_005186 [Dispira parvispora]
MASMNIDFDKLDRDHRLSQEEKEAMAKAAQRFNFFTNGMGLLGAGFVFTRCRMRNNAWGKTMLLSTMGYLVGSSIGSAIGVFSAARALKRSPHYDRIYEVISDNYNRAQQQHQGQTRSNPRQSQGRTEPSQSNPPGFPSDQESVDTYNFDAPVSERSSDVSGTLPERREFERSSPNNRWDEIRTERAGTGSAWDRVRQSTIKNSRSQFDHPEQLERQSDFGSRNDLPPTDTSNVSDDNTPRTREAMEDRVRSGKVRTNKYGDIEEY